MANELSSDYLVSKNVYFLVRNASQQIWNGSTFENYNAVNYANYPILATEQGSSGYYVGSFPVTSAGVYSTLSKERIGGSPAESDITVGTGTLVWDGSAIWSVSSIFTTDISGTIENNASVHSLATSILKLTSKFDAKLGTTYKTDGSTVKMTQAPTTDATMTPIRSLGVGL